MKVFLVISEDGDYTFTWINWTAVFSTEEKAVEAMKAKPNLGCRILEKEIDNPDYERDIEIDWNLYIFPEFEIGKEVVLAKRNDYWGIKRKSMVGNTYPILDRRFSRRKGWTIDLKLEGNLWFEVGYLDLKDGNNPA